MNLQEQEIDKSEIKKTWDQLVRVSEKQTAEGRGGEESEKGYKSARYSFQCDCHSCIVNQGLYF